MALSPQYSWPEPDNSSLVKNGAQDIRALGDAIDTSVWNVGFGQAGKNKIINGDFAINQRGFTSTTTSGVFTYDRFLTTAAGSDGTATFSGEAFTLGSAPVAGYEGKNYLRILTAGMTAADTGVAISQSIESVRTFAGQTVTVSFWAKAATGTPSVAVRFRQNFGTGGSANVDTYGSPIALTTSWVRYSKTISVPSITGKTIGTSDALVLSLVVSAGATGFGGLSGLTIQNNTFDLWGFQAEYGSKMTPFQTASGGSPQAELAMCQRYYWRSAPNLAFANFGFGFASLTTRAVIGIPAKITMRTPPISVDFSNLRLDDTATASTVTACTINAGATTSDLIVLNTDVASGLTQFRNYRLGADNSTAAYVGFSAELQEMTMDNVTFIEVEGVEHAIIDRGNGEFTSMLKSTYDELKANEAETE